MANKKVIRGNDTITRIAACWEEVSINPADRPTVKEFAKRAGIAAVTFYRYYPEWVEKVRLKRDEPLNKPRRLSPKAQRNQQKAAEVEAITLIERLRVEVKMARQELQAVKKDRDRWAKQAQEDDQMQQMNERLRGTLLMMGRVLKKHVDSTKAQAILDELEKLQSNKLQVVQKSD